MNPIHFQAIPVTLDAAAGDGEPPRTITGIAAPWDTAATVLSGERVMFRRGAFATDAKMPKLIEGHDMTALRGVVTELVELEEGLGFTAKFAKTRAADDAIELIKAGAYDSVSVGAIPVRYKYNKDGVMEVTAARLVEISLVAQAAFGDAAPITEIAAAAPEVEADETPTQDDSKEEPMSDSPETLEASAPAVIPTAPLLAAAPRREFRLPSAAEYISKFIAGGSEFAEFNAQIRAAAPDVTTADSPGILPEPIVGSVYNNFRGLRPVVDAIGTKAMPAGGKIFRRPSVTTHTTIGASNGENAALDAGQFIVSDNPVTKGVYGGYVRLSEEDQEWTQPEVLALLIDDMSRIYANETDNVAADALITGTTNSNNFTAANIADPTDWVTWMYTAASDILTASNGWLPTHLFAAPNRWASMGQLEDGQGRPLFPQVGPMNAYGNASPGQATAVAFGLQVVVDRNFASGTLAVGHPDGFEIYERQQGAISVEAADGSLSRYVKFRGQFATLMIDSTKFIKAAFV